MRRVVVTADDFGLCAAVNRAVARAHDEGVLTSASLLANGPAFEEAVAIARARPALSIGVHLTLFRGRPLSPPARVASLLDARGCFLANGWRLFARGVSGRVARDEIRLECEAQVARILAAGLKPAFVNSEKHAHHWLPGF